MNKKCLLFVMSMIVLLGQPSFAETSAVRKIEYQQVLALKDFKDNPFAQYSLLLKQMISHGVVHPQAATLSNIKENGFPTSRTLAIKEVTDQGFIFFIDPQSNKAKQLSNNPHVALLVVWHDPINKMSYQIKMEGLASKYALEKKIRLEVNKKTNMLNWQAYIVKPDNVEFSLLHSHNDVGIIEYMNYHKSKNQWVKQRNPKDGIAPCGC